MLTFIILGSATAVMISSIRSLLYNERQHKRKQLQSQLFKESLADMQKTGTWNGFLLRSEEHTTKLKQFDKQYPLHSPPLIFRLINGDD
jgi:hypothetical protein